MEPQALSSETGCLEGRSGGPCICPVLESDPTAAFSARIPCCLLPWCVSPPRPVCLWMAFLLLWRRIRLFPGQCHLSAQWTLKALHSTYHPEAHSMHELLKGSIVWAHMCVLAQASQAPGEAPGMRQSVRMRLGKETRVVVPVVCSQMSLCGALVLEAGGSLRVIVTALH